MTPVLKAPGTKRLKLKFGESPSSFAFEFNWRRYTLATFGGEALTNAAYAAVLWKLNAEGTTLWAVRGSGARVNLWGGKSMDRLDGVAVDNTGGVVAAGSFTSSPATFGDVVLTSAGSTASLLWKLNAEGTTLWAVSGVHRSIVAATLTSVDVYSGGEVVTVGSFAGPDENVWGVTQSYTATFGGVRMATAGDKDAVVWKVSAEVGRCRLTISKPVLKAPMPMISVLETGIS